MISEPELAGDDGDGAHGTGAARDRAAPESVPEAETLAGEGRPGRDVLRGRPPWAWALGGALAASLLWAGGLYAYDLTGPDLRGYGATRDLCAAAELPALTVLLGPKREPRPGGDRDEAVDRAICHVRLERPGRSGDRGGGGGGEGFLGGTPSYAAVVIEYTLHKKADPAPEFEALAAPVSLHGQRREDMGAVPGLGDRAFLVTSPERTLPGLRVLDGAAELSLSVYEVTGSVVDPATGEFEEDEPLRLAEIEPDLIEDMRALMAALKK
ncbi:hypothetical protein ACFXP3_11655 [Streptomyces sp. NPDC059096]|uniref:hypothetical protein n=1 Tax=Streptomyces sp. NPDC059096 TaxID=3346727 RepID=UPI003690F4E8